MSEKTIISFYCIGFCLGLYQLLLWHKLIIRFPVICKNYSSCQFFNILPQFHSCCCSTCANFAIDEPVPISINSNPDPTIVFFDPIYVCISSNSITSISSEFLNSSNCSPKDLIQLKTATWLRSKTFQ